jgi:hypothetical protein
MECFEQTLKVQPDLMSAVRELSVIYAEYLMDEKIVSLYDRVIEADRLGPLLIVDDEDEDEQEGETLQYRMSYEDIETVTRVFIKENQYERACSLIVECSCRMAGIAENQFLSALYPTLPATLQLRFYACSVHLGSEGDLEVNRRSSVHSLIASFSSTDIRSEKRIWASGSTYPMPFLLQGNSMLQFRL